MQHQPLYDVFKCGGIRILDGDQGGEGSGLVLGRHFQQPFSVLERNAQASRVQCKSIRFEGDGVCI